ncbi:hypothetical protein Tco_0370078 [Tanacetum coccineum]
MCKAYGGEPSVDLLRSFLNLGRAGDWLTLSNRGGVDVSKALTKAVTHLEDWKGLKSSWKYSPKNHVIYHRGQGVDGEFNFLPEGGLDENRISTKSVNNEAPMINTYPIFAMHPSNIAKNIVDSHNISSDEGGLSPIGPDAPLYLEEGKRSTVVGKRKVAFGSHGEGPHRKARKVPAQASKVAGDASSPLNVDSDSNIHGKLDPSTLRKFPSAKELKDATDFHWVIAHVTPPSWKQHLREISIKQLCDIHDKAYMRQAVLDNVLNGKTRELISALHKARASCDTMWEKEIKKDKAYAELEKKCNEALQDLDKNPLISDMRAEIETLQSHVNGLHSEYSRLILEEKKWINYEQTLSTFRAKEVDSLRQDRAAVVSRVIPDAATKLIHSDEMGVLIARLVKASIIYGRCTAFEEVAILKKPFVLEEMLGYRPSSKEDGAIAVEEAAVTSIKVFVFKGFIKMSYTKNEVVRLMMFPLLLTRETKTWLDELNEGTIETWDELQTAFISRFFPSALFDRLLREI